jgi:dihydropteroate synthase
MGVINITPDSFSDGAKFNTPSGFQEKFQSLASTCDIIDIGAESTAPFNAAIDSITELERFQKIFYPLLQATPAPDCAISIDTYKIEVFKQLYQEIKKYWPKVAVIFNDISGSIDLELMDLLNSDLEFSYVYSHNLAPTRLESSNHINYLFKGSNEEFLESVTKYFKEASLKFSNTNKTIYFDPCFGFSKSREQNQLLITKCAEVFNKLNRPLVYGISRKSFMRFPKDLDSKDHYQQKVMDSMQSILFTKLINDYKFELVLRVHDMASLEAVENIMSIYES